MKILKSFFLVIVGVGVMSGNAMATLINYDVDRSSEPASALSSRVDINLLSGLDKVLFDLDQDTPYTFDFLSARLGGIGEGFLLTEDFNETFTVERLTWADSILNYSITSENSFAKVSHNFMRTRPLGPPPWAPGPPPWAPGPPPWAPGPPPGAPPGQPPGPAPVPEPATLILFGAGLLGLATYARKKRKII